MRALTAAATAIAIAIALVFALAAVPSLAWAKPHVAPPGQAKDAGALDRPQRHGPAEQKGKHQGFSPQDEVIVRGYFTGQRRWTSLPAGIAKTYVRGKKLPDDIVKKYLPVWLEAELTMYLDATYYLVGRDVVLVDTTSRIVLDVVKDVFH